MSGKVEKVALPVEKQRIKVFLTQHITPKQYDAMADDFNSHNLSPFAAVELKEATILRDDKNNEVTPLCDILPAIVHMLSEGPISEPPTSKESQDHPPTITTSRVSGGQMCCRSVLLGQGICDWRPPPDKAGRKTQYHFPLYRNDSDPDAEQKYCLRVHRG